MIPSLAGRPGARTVLWLLAAAWALAFPLFSTLGPHRTWGWCAAAGYLAAAALTARSPRAAVAAALTGAVALPLAWLVLTGRGQSEVVVVARSGRLLLDTGRLYVEDPAGVDAYTPYLPGMALFGIPQALLGRAGDPRIWCAAAFFAALWGAARLSTASRLRGASLPAWLPVLTASPVVALPLAVSGIDLPLAGLCCLALAAAGAGRPVLTGAALAAACALKWTALPAIAVAAALLAARAGRRTAVHAVLAAAVCTALLVLPAALLQPREMWRQVFLFPTGRADVPTPASSPLPGRLLADLVPGGWALAAALLLLAGLAVAASLAVRPPRTAAEAADRLALGLALAFLLAPAGRFGYLALPVLLVVWARTTARPARTPRIVARSRHLLVPSGRAGR